MGSHEEQDAKDLIRTEIQLLLRQYKRRVQTVAEGIYERQALAAAHGETHFDHTVAAKEAVAAALNEWLGVPLPAVEGKAIGR